MKQPTFNGKELLPLSVMEAAHAGDAAARWIKKTEKAACKEISQK